MTETVDLLKTNPALARAVKGFTKFITTKQLEVMRRLDAEQWAALEKVVHEGEKPKFITRILVTLEDCGFVESDENEVTKLYTLTEKGVYAERCATEMGK